ncbi:MAG: alpha/beta fold hydrolase [Candidatus Sulfotelmatobacter sp.]
MMISGSTSSPTAVDGQSRLWFESLSSSREKALRVFCFPYAGGNANIFRDWQRHFPPDIDLCLVHLPGRGKRSGGQPFTRLEPLVQTIADLIMREPQFPYILFGHSVGALISFELARELRRRRFTLPRRLFLSGRRAPTTSSEKDPVFNLADDAFIAEVKRLNGTPKEVLEHPETRRLFLPVLRADFEIDDTYEYYSEERLSCPITVYGGLQDRDISLESLRAWEEQTSADCKLTMFPGDHFFLLSPEAGFVDVFRRDAVSILRYPAQAV